MIQGVHLDMAPTLTPLLVANAPASAGYGNFRPHTQENVDLNLLITKGRPGFVVFVVTGDSAAPLIHPGSVVICDTLREPRPNDLVVVEHNDLIYVKILETKPKLRLVSPNESYEPREVEEGDAFCVYGVVVAALNIFNRSEREYRLTGT